MVPDENRLPERDSVSHAPGGLEAPGGLLARGSGPRLQPRHAGGAARLVITPADHANTCRVPVLSVSQIVRPATGPNPRQSIRNIISGRLRLRIVPYTAPRFPVRI